MKKKSVEISDNTISTDRRSIFPRRKRQWTMDTGQWPFCLCKINSMADDHHQPKTYCGLAQTNRALRPSDLDTALVGIYEGRIIVGS